MSPDRSLLFALLAERLGDLDASEASRLLDAVSRGPASTLAEPAGDEARTWVAEVADVLATRAPDLKTVAPAGEGTGPAGSGRADFRYLTLRPHKEGGLGAVYLAHDTEVDRQVALKEMKPRKADSPSSRARFLFEASVTGRLEHPGIVPVYGLGTYPDGRPYYAMRFVEGESLDDAIRAFHGGPTNPDVDVDAGRRPTLRDLLGRFLDVCDAVEYAHSRGVLHRDLKPQNVMLGGYGETLVVDWGLARIWRGAEPEAPGDPSGEVATRDMEASGFSTIEGSAIGTPGYMSPEQAAGRLDGLGPATDIYSLGAILYALLTGQAPLPAPDGGDLPSMLNRIERGEFRRPREIRPAVDRALEAVCLKALALDPDDRYAAARDLADDVRRWLADEPVAAWREPFPRRARRWVGKHRTPVTAAAVALLVALLGGVAYISERLATARGRVEALRAAEIRAVPGILDELGGDRRLVLDRIRGLAAEGQPEKARLRGLLALAREDASPDAELTRRMLDPATSPDELIVIRQALDPDRARPAVLDGLGPDARSPLSDRQLRAFAALARSDPDHPRWVRDAPRVAARLTGENLLVLSSWREAFQPVSRHLLGPLRAIFADPTRPEDRDRAFVLLLAFSDRPDSPDRPEDLASLIADSDPGRCEEVLRRLATAADRDRAIRVLRPRLAPVARFDDLAARRQGRMAAALLRLGVPDPVWPLFKASDDPSTRTELIHDATAFGVPVELLVARLRDEPDATARRALILAIGSYPPDALAPADREALQATLLDWYRRDPDAGIHGAAAWVLDARWGLAAERRKLDGELAGRPAPAGQGWTVNRLGQTFAILPGPITVSMGATRMSDPDSPGLEVPHARTIPRSFAIAAREVSVAEYAAYLAANPGQHDPRKLPGFSLAIPTSDGPMGVIDYYACARYCNWLSLQDGLPESEWCYPREPSEGMVLPDDHLKRRGYRLPTDGEWEAAARAGTLSARYFGGLPDRVDAYGWNESNAGRLAHPTGRLKPNDLGLFDMLGNAYEWCADAYLHEKPLVYAVDRLNPAPFHDEVVRILRGGSYLNNAGDLRSSGRGRRRPRERNTNAGFRPARTLP